MKFILLKLYLLILGITCLFNIGKSQNLLQDVMVNHRDSLIWGFNSDLQGCSFAFCSLSQCRYGTTFNKGQWLYPFYFDLNSQKQQTDYLQIPFYKTLEKDSIYELYFTVDPRFTRKKYSKNRTVRLSILDSTLTREETKNIIRKNSSNWNILASDLLQSKEKEVPFTYTFKSLGKEKAVFIWVATNKKEWLIFTITDLCLKKSNTSCELPFYYPDTITTAIKLDNYLDVYFDMDIDTLDTEQQNRLNQKLSEYDNISVIQCIGFADSTGWFNYNLRLSARRAENVKYYVQTINPNLKVVASGKGISRSETNGKNRFVRIIFE